MKNIIRKGKTKRPIHIRVLAVVMALVMVLSVIYINHREDRVKAETFVNASGTDDTYLSGKVEVGKESEEYIVNVPATGIKFKLPTIGDFDDETEEDTAYEITTKETTPGEEGADPVVNETVTYKKNNPYTNEDDKPDNVDVKKINISKVSSVEGEWTGDVEDGYISSGSGTATATVKITKTVKKYMYGDKDISEVLGLPSDGTTSNATVVKVVTYAISDLSITGSNADKSFAFSDGDSSKGEAYNTETDFYYSKTSYSYSVDGVDKGEASLDEINGIINGTGIEGDAEYVVSKKVTVPNSVTIAGSETDVIDDSQEKTIVRNYYVLKDASATVEGSSVGVYDSESKTLTIPADGLNTQNPSKSIEVVFTTDADAGNSIDNTNATVAASAISGDQGGYSFTVPADIEKNNGNTSTYLVNIKDGDAQDTLTVVVNYGDGTPTISDEAFDNTPVSTDTKYIKDKDHAISFTVSTSSGAYVKKAELYKSTGTSPIFDSGDLESEQLPSKTISFSLGDLASDDISEGHNRYKVKAISSFGLDTTSSNVFDIFYDSTDPVAKDIKVSQTDLTGFGGNGSYEESATSCDITNKITSRADASIELSVSDGTGGSGIDKVTFNDSTENVTYNDEDNITKATYTLKADSNNDGKDTMTIPIKVYDKAGNYKDYTVTVHFYNEKIDIVPEYMPSGEPYTKDSKKYFVWEEGKEKKAFIKYSVTSEVPIKEAKITINGNEESSKTLSLDTDLSDTANNLYVFMYDFENTTEGDYTIEFTATSKTGNFETENTVVRSIDLTKPGMDVSIDGSSVLGTESWYQKVILNVKVSDNASGVAKVIAEGVQGFEGEGEITSFDEGKFTTTVNTSKNTSGTAVKFTVVDNAGNKGNTPDYSNTFYVDDVKPEATLDIGGKTVSEVNGKVLSDEPVIKWNVTDALSGLDSTAGLEFTVSNGSTVLATETTGSTTGKKLSELVGAISDDVDYTVTLKGKDKAGNEVTPPLTATFRVDNSAPVVSGKIITTAEKSKYPRTYKTDVTYELEAIDTNLKESGLKVVDTKSNKEIDVSWDKVDTGHYKATVTTTTEGTYSIKFTATDEAGLSGKWDTDSTFTIDKTKPDITTLVNAKVYDNPNDFFDNTATVTLQIKDTNEDEKDVTTTIKRTAFDGTETTETKNGKGPFICSSEGRYVITTKAVDKAGNENTKTIGFTVDKTNPEPKIDIITKPLKIEGYFNQSSVELAFEIDDPTVLERDITVTDNGNKVTVSWTFKDGKATAKYNATTEGEHSVTVAVKDQADNEAKTTKTFVIDRTKPKLTTKVNSKEYNSKDDYFPGNVTSNVVVKDDNEDKKDITTTIEYDSFSGNYSEEEKKGKGPFTFKKQGKYKITYKAVDKAGNEKTKVVGFYIDKTNPVGNMYIKTDKPPKFSKFGASYINKVKKFKQRKDQEAYAYGQYYNTNVTIEFNYFDYGMDSVTITDGDEEIIPDWTEDDGYGKGTAKITDEGHHVIKMTIEDKAGNTVSYKSGTKILDFYIDKTPPVVSASVNGSASGDVVSTNGSGSVSVSVEDANKDPDDITMTVSSSGAGGGSSKVSEGSQSFSGEADYDVQFTAVDKAGNSSSPASAKFRVDHTAPELDITSNATNGASKKDVEVTFSIKETFYNDLASSKIDVYRKVDGDTEKHYKTINFTPRGTSDSMTETFKEDGEYRCVFSARDRAGNDASKSYTFILDGSKPIITLSGVANYDKTDKSVELGVQVDETFYLTNKVKLDGTKTDIEGKTESIDFGKFPSDSAKISELSKMFKEDGIYDITVSSTDKAGNTDTKTLHFTIDKTAPVIDDLSAYDGKNVSSFDLEKPLEELVKDLTVCEIKMYMDGNLYDGTGALSDGSHVLRIEATDEMGHTSTKEVTFVLDTIAPNIIITGAEDGAVLKDATKVTVSVELDGDFLDYVKVNGKAYAVSGNECQIDIDKRGRYTLEAAASDGAGNKSSMEIHFSYGRGLLWMIIGGVVILIGLLAGFLALLGKRKKESNE
ncbi:MAG: Ig-like domain repeat protein [Eubacterium sp.]|nr:Ig-like domain repeat protein [Eubacterium sp.]